MSEKILLIETGGTFASRCGEDGLRAVGNVSVSENQEVALRTATDDISFQTYSPFRILSENMTIFRLEELLLSLSNQDFKNYDGVIICHGTDTFAYSVNLVAFALGNIDIPIVFVAADHPLNEENSNGIPNFLAALTVICRGEKGVFAVYRNGDGIIYVHRGGRLRQMDDIHVGFFSQGNIPYGWIKGERLIKNEDPLNHCRSVSFGGFPSSVLSRGILQLCPYPGFDYAKVNLDGIEAVLQRTYHTGMFCSEGREENLTLLLENAAERDIPVVIVGGSEREEGYVSALNPGKNTLFLKDVAPEAVYAKMLLAYGICGGLSALAYVKTDLIGETVRT